MCSPKLRGLSSAFTPECNEHTRTGTHLYRTRDRTSGCTWIWEAAGGQQSQSTTDAMFSLLKQRVMPKV